MFLSHHFWPIRAHGNKIKRYMRKERKKNTKSRKNQILFKLPGEFNTAYILF
uniref:Uncharacterized protein n=1 Tax=Meloidogyne enterolobii TaxID=390850 RepID=A0A6V7X1G8_MELEN|nr:unnamed protein product [Meloidogyne enterolobii]